MSGETPSLTFTHISNRNRRRLVVISLWILAVLGTLALAYERYHSNASFIPRSNLTRSHDFWIFYHAAQQISDGRSPYAVHLVAINPGYVYSPLVALLLVPFVHLGVSVLWRAWLAASVLALVATAVLASRAEAFSSKDWSAPVLFGVASGSLLRFQPTIVLFSNGNSDAFVLFLLGVAALATERGRGIASGVLLGLVGVIKTWPWAIVLVVVRRGVVQRRRTVLAFALVSMSAPLLALFPRGPSELLQWMRNSTTASSQNLVSTSVWGAPRALFTTTGTARPVLVSTPLHWLTMIIFAAWVIALLTICLRWSTNSRLSFWNITGCVVLLLPVSHADYTVYLLPIMWIWLARALSEKKWRSPTTLVAGAMCIWWVSLLPATFFSWQPTASAVSVEIPFFANLLAVSISVASDQFLSRGPATGPLAH